MRFNPRSEAEIMSLNLIDPGTYQAEVVEFHDGDQYGNPLMSKSGNPMTKVVLHVWDMQGVVHTIYDYLVDTDKMAFKIRHFCAATDNLDKYEAREDIKGVDVLGKLIKVNVGIQVGTAAPDGSLYPNKNVIKDYVTPLAVVDVRKEDIPFNDDIKL